ncbi:putative metalloprotease ARX1 [Yarrowia sp. C11]|nr:putative metalloprotease ARX1 [Yarrowia sp. C11]
MSLARSTALLDEKNTLTSDVTDKYRLAGKIAQTCLQHIIQTVLTQYESFTVGEMCRMGDDFLERATTAVYKSVAEKGIAQPVRIEKQEFVAGVSPENGDKFQGGMLAPGDLVKITLGVYIDGYTAQVTQTEVVRHVPAAGETEQPLTGSSADAVCAAYLASEAVIAYLAQVTDPNPGKAVGEVSGTKIRELVEKIAAAYHVKIVPGSAVRRVRRFLAGQHSIVLERDLKGVLWEVEGEEERALHAVKLAESEAKQESTEGAVCLYEQHIAEEENFSVEAGEAYQVDIQMAAAPQKGAMRLYDFEGYDESGTVINQYGRDFSVTYGLKIQASRKLLSQLEARTSVYPFKLSHVESNVNKARLGLGEILAHQILVPLPVQIAKFVPLTALYEFSKSNKARARDAAAQAVPVARYSSTVLLTSDSCLRLSGGQAFPPPYVQSAFELPEDVTNLLKLVGHKHGAKVKDVLPGDVDMAPEKEAVMEE